MPSKQLRHGDLVEIRSPAEILATLDADGRLEALPFMIEMAQYCGQRFVVDRRAEKVCDTVEYSGSRHMPDSVLLNDMRCDGSAHGGCQAECRPFWKEVWLKPVQADSPASPPYAAADRSALEARAARNMHTTVTTDGKAEERWSCQSTDIVKATQRIGTFDPRPYVRQYTCGNVTFPHFLKVTARAVVQEPMRKLGLIDPVHLKGPGTRPASADPALHLKPGELVRIKSVEQIQQTLNEKGYNRGLWFDR